MSLQPERTDLAWRRTGLSTLGLALVGIKLGLDGTAVHIAAGVVAAVAAAAFALLARWRSTALLAATVPSPIAPPVLAAVTATIVALHVAGLALVLVPT